MTDLPLIFLHGIGGDKTHFTKVVQRLTQYECHVLNLPGYGSTSTVTEPLSFSSLCQWLSAYLRSIKAQKAHLIGHSLGGMVALEHAVRFPQQVASLTMIGATSAFGGKDDTFKTRFLKERLAPLDAGMSMAEMAEKAIPSLLGSLADKSALDAGVHSMAQISAHQWRNVLTCLVSFNQRESVSDITIPVCVIAGAEDTNAPAQTLEKMAGKFPHAEYHCLDGIGHLLPLEAPSKIGHIIHKFIG